MGDELFRGKKMSMNNCLDFWIVTTKGRDARKNVMFYPPKKAFNHSNSPRNERNAGVNPLDKNNSTIEHLHKILMPKCEPRKGISFHVLLQHPSFFDWKTYLVLN